ncbi:hypothetical protein BJ546DRAFT_532518 [Cryomyces antarcticus]
MAGISTQIGASTTGVHALPRQPTVRLNRDKRDENVMATNNSSIVSKRSVEKLYYHEDTEFFRYFVKKFQRRSPLINRGYWLRMRAVDHVIRNFLQEHAEKKKVIINLGCG